MITLWGKNLSSVPTCAKRGTLMLSGCRADRITFSRTSLRHPMCHYMGTISADLCPDLM